MNRRRYPRNNDPYWLTAKYKGQCKQCCKEIAKGSRAFYYPTALIILCEQCGEDEARQFEAAKADEYFFNNQ